MKIPFKTSQIILGFMLSLTVCSAFAQAANKPYVIKGGEVYDKKTGLTWQRCSEGQHWRADATGCVGIVKVYTFDDAQQLATGEWRVPTKEELLTLVDQNKAQRPRIDEVAFPDMDKSILWYWTSTHGVSGGWGVDFGDGHLDNYYDGYFLRSATVAVRLVRGGQ
jgi:hypothetical protein